MKTVELNEAEQRLVKYMAEKRIAYSRQVRAQATLYGDREAVKNELDSFGAEVAYCKLYNIYPDLDWSHFAPADARLGNGKTVDIKHTVRGSGRLLVKAMERPIHPDYYALMIGEFPVYRLVGHILADEMLKPENIDKTLPHPAYAVGQERLR